MALVDRSLAVWQQQRTCFSCHHQALPIAAIMLARSRGIAFDEALARKNISAGLLPLKSLDRNVQGYQQIDLSMEIGTELVTGAIAGVPPGIARAAAARTVAGWQLPDGHWTTLDVRPPQSFGTIPATAMAIRGVQAYWPAGHDAELAERTARARAWLLNSAPRDTADMVFRLRGLRWTDAAAADIAQAAAAPCARHSAPTAAGASCPPEAGCLRHRRRDAGAARVGLPVTDDVYQRGLRFFSITSCPMAPGASRHGCTSSRWSARRTSSGLPARRAPDGLLHGFDAGGHRGNVARCRRSGPPCRRWWTRPSGGPPTKRRG